jgi:single-strand DNA-binding protein
VPSAWPHPPAAARSWTAGTELIVTGRVRRRYFRAGGSTQSRTEVVATRAAPTRRQAAVGKVLAAALGSLPEQL